MMMLLLGIAVGVIFSLIYFYFGHLRQIHLAYQLEIEELKQQHAEALASSTKRSVNTSRAVLRGKLAEQFAPIFPEFDYLPSDAKFLGDPIDYVVFSGYSEYREGLCGVDGLEIVFIDIKSGRAKLTEGQKALSYAIEQGRVRFETIWIDV